MDSRTSPAAKGPQTYPLHCNRLSDCIALQTNLLEESDCPLQRTEILAFQELLTTLDADDIPVPVTISPTLPRELVERILLFLDTTYIPICRLVNREFNEIIQSSTLLQYFLACKAAGVIDNPRSPLSYGERLEGLLKREDAWRTLIPSFKTTIKVNHQPSECLLYNLTEGAYFLDDRNERDLHYCQLPSSPRDNPQWIRSPSHVPEEGTLVNFSTSVYEHDLIIKVISSDIGNQAEDTHRYSIDLILLKFSTGEYHPLARNPRINVQRFPSSRLWVSPTIVCDNLALVVHSEDGAVPDKLFIFDWKSGYKRLQHETTKNTYSDLVFVSPEILLVPNLIQSHFEIWHLPPNHPDPKPPVQLLALKIPTISRYYSLAKTRCIGEPIPSFLHSMPPRPFFPSPEHSIIIAKLYLDSLQDARRVTSTLIMPRRALLDTIQKWISPSLCEQLENLPMWLKNEITVDKVLVADPDGGLVRLDAQSKLVATHTSTFSSASRTSHISADSSSSSISPGSSTTSSTTQYNFFNVKWADWGPPISRWFQVNGGQWSMTSIGQRLVFSVPNPRDRSKLMVRVADFNQPNFRRNMDMMARLRTGEGKNCGSNDNNEKGKEQVEEEELERFDHQGVFSEDVCMGLKCVVYHAPDEYDFEGVLMDEERLLGVKVDSEGMEESITVFYFG